jgi:hypothetical protein
MMALSALAALSVTASAATAATLYATGVDWTNNGTVGSSNDRNNPLNSLGAPDGKFMSLGRGGQADFTFGQLFTGPGESYEITFGNRSSYVETADVFAGYLGAFQKVGSVNNASAAGIVFNFSGFFDTLRLVDTTTFTGSPDGYDVDAVGVTPFGPNPAPSPVPLPASAVLLGAGLAGLRLLRRKA